MTAFSFFWHDYETFGRVPRRDRPAQFAGIRTDADLNEIGRPVMHYCRPAPDSLPDPESCLLTGIVPQTCLEQGLPEHAFAAEIEGALAQPGTVGVGYNTIRFDDEVTRHLFWRNLIDPYAREWQNECGRWDLVDMVRATWALRPEGIEWPFHDDGRPSFKLEHLTKANGIAHEAAHDALSDVRATIALARLIKSRQPRLWEFCLRLRRKEAVWAEIGAARPFLHLSGMYGLEQGSMAIVYPLAPHPTNKNELLVWDLAHDPQELAGLDAETLRLRMFTRTADLPEGVGRLPVKSIHVNKSPIVVGNLKTLTPAGARALRARCRPRASARSRPRPTSRSLMQGACSSEVYAARPAAAAAALRRRRRPVRRLRRQRRPAQARTPASPDGRTTGRPARRVRRRSARGIAVSLSRPQFPRFIGARRAGPLDRSLQRPPARRGGRVHHACRPSSTGSIS